jgi:hypothetical protein
LYGNKGKNGGMPVFVNTKQKLAGNQIFLAIISVFKKGENMCYTEATL